MAAVCGRSPRGWPPGASHPDERLYIPMPFFWTGGFSSGLMSVLVAGATLLTEATPEPEPTLALLERETRRSFAAGPTRRRAWRRTRASPTADLSSLRAGSLPAVLPPEPAIGARERAPTCSA